MQREYIETFLGMKPEDIDDLTTIRRRFDRRLIHENQFEIPKEKYLFLIKDQEKIEQIKYLKTLSNQTEKIIFFPYQSFLNIRHWRKPPKTLKIFFQALTCFLSISHRDFLTELKLNQNFIRNIRIYQPSSIVMNEFRMKYLNLYEISCEYIRKKSFDAYMIAIWMHSIEENERLRQLEIENRLKEIRN